MVVDEPVNELTLATVLEVTQDEVSAALAELVESYADRGFALKCVAGGWRFYSHPDSANVVEKFVLDGQQSRLTQAALETGCYCLPPTSLTSPRFSYSWRQCRGSHEDSGYSWIGRGVRA